MKNTFKNPHLFLHRQPQHDPTYIPPLRGCVSNKIEKDNNNNNKKRECKSNTSWLWVEMQQSNILSIRQPNGDHLAGVDV